MVYSHFFKYGILYFFSRILALEKLGAVFNQSNLQLQYTPRSFVIHPESNRLILIEMDHNAYTEETATSRKQQMAEVSKQERSDASMSF